MQVVAFQVVIRTELTVFASAAVRLTSSTVKAILSRKIFFSKEKILFYKLRRRKTNITMSQ